MSPKVIIVTGVSRGIGRAIVNKIIGLNSNAVVFGIARTSAPLKELKSKHGEKFFYIVGDVTNKSDVKKLITAAIDKFGRLDSVVANAGVLEPVAEVGKVDEEAWKRLFDINFFSIVSLVQSTLPFMENTNGNYVFVSSGASVKAYFGWAAYSASKAALNSFAMSVANEKPKVKTISVAPGVVDTQMQVDIREKYGNEMTTESLKRFIDLHKNGELLDSDVPGEVYAKLAVNGIPDELNGKYSRYNDDRLASL